MKKFLVIGLALLVSGCVTNYKLKNSGQTSDMWNAYSVSSSEPLNEAVENTVVVWTKYGPILEAIHFWKPVEDGESLPFPNKGSDGDKQKFRSDMTASEVVDLYRAALGADEKIVISLSAPEPAIFGGKDAYRVKGILSSSKGYDFKSDLVFTVDNGALYMIELRSAAVHYFEERQKAFNQIISSVKL